MIEIGTLGFPYRASAIATGFAMTADSEGVDALWYPDTPGPLLPLARWREAAGPLAEVVPDPADRADPVVAATVALLATRRARIGVLGLAVTDPFCTARSLLTLADLAPGRVIAAVAPAPDATLDALREALAARPGADGAELVLLADTDEAARRAAGLGLGWLATGPITPADVAARARAAPGTTGGVQLTVVAHHDDAVARKALEAPLLEELAALAGDRAGAVVCGTPADVADAVSAFADAGATRVILDNVLALGLPEELEAANRASAGAVRAAHLQLRSQR